VNAQSKVKPAKRQLADGVAFAVPLADFLAVKPFIATEESRYYLRGVRIEPHEEGAIAVATNGHILGVQYSPKGYCATPGIWICPKALKLARGKNAPEHWVVGTVNGSVSRLHLVHATRYDKDADVAAYVSEFPAAGLDEMSWGHSLIDGTYPDWRKVLPDATPDDAFRAFNGEKLKAFGNAIVMRGKSIHDPHLIQNGDPNFLGVAMPMRNEMYPQDWMCSLSKGLFA
jgi:hypothetical protein